MEIANEVQQIVKSLSNNEVVLTPTDTIWGLSVNPFLENTYKKLFHIKERPFEKKVILLVSNTEMLNEFAFVYPKIETLLLLHKRPLTIIYKAKKSLPSHLVSEDSTIAIRLVKEGLIHDVIELLRKPIASTSANLSNEDFPTSFDTITDVIKDKVDYIVPPHYDTVKQKEPSVIAKMDDRAKELIFVRQ